MGSPLRRPPPPPPPHPSHTLPDCLVFHLHPRLLQPSIASGRKWSRVEPSLQPCESVGQGLLGLQARVDDAPCNPILVCAVACEACTLLAWPIRLPLGLPLLSQHHRSCVDCGSSLVVEGEPCLNQGTDATFILQTTLDTPAHTDGNHQDKEGEGGGGGSAFPNSKGQVFSIVRVIRDDARGKREGRGVRDVCRCACGGEMSSVPRGPRC